VDEEVRKIMEDCYNESKRILSENMEAMDMIADELIREETISGKDFMRLYRQAKGLPEPDGSEKAEKAEENAENTAEAVPALPAAEEPAKAEPVEFKAPEIAEKPADAEPVKIAETVEEETEAAPAEPENAAEEDNEDDDDEEFAVRPAEKKEIGTKGRFSDVPKEDVDRFFKDK
jgi:cell division protease FtsH